MTAVAAAAVRPGALPRSFLAWLGAATLSTYGDSALYFALGWTATGIGPLWAGLVVTVITLPRTVLLLVGGAVGDRWGPRRVMVCGDELHGEMVGTGEPFCLNYAMFMTIRDGQITHARDYADPIAGARILGKLPELLTALAGADH